MRRATLEATDENILNSIQHDDYYRNSDVLDFVTALDQIEGNMFISLDAGWGEGKTFFVRQVEKTLEFATKREWGESSSTLEELRSYFQKTVLNATNLNNSYLPIYYNAWLYDNHDDPLMSLVFTIVKKTEQYLDTQFRKTVGQKLSSLLSAVSANIFGKYVQVSLSGEKIGETFEGQDILKNVRTSEQIRELVKELLNEVITERAQRLVIFLDELDRCRPSYAIEMLERIKHYFDDERIIFVISVNKEQLIHTISKYYGYGFDSTGYLNKFFDLNAHMPPMKISINEISSEAKEHRPYHFIQIAEELGNYYKLSLRDSLIYQQKILATPINQINDHSAQGCCLSLFVPIIFILDIKNQNEKAKFLSGKSEILDILALEIPAIRKLVRRFGGQEESIKFENGLVKFKNTYKYIFDDLNYEGYNNVALNVSFDLKRICIKLCNGG